MSNLINYCVGDDYSFDDLTGQVSTVLPGMGIYVMDNHGQEHFVPLEG